MPLDWPPGYPRTDPQKRTWGHFKQQRGDGYGMARVSLSTAQRRLQDEVRKMNGTDLRVDTAHREQDYRLDGGLRANARTPDDPGVVVRFRVHGRPVEFACDAYTHIESNIAAVAATINAKRAILRHGCATADREFQGYAALPPGDTSHGSTASAGATSAPQTTRRTTLTLNAAAELLEVSVSASADIVRAAFRTKSRDLHPDRTGQEATESWHLLQQARDLLLTR